MKRAVYVQRDLEQIGTIQGLTSVFEAIASIHVAQIRDKVLSSTTFFHELWQTYRQLRREDDGLARQPTKPRPALLAITSAGGLIGDIDERIVAAMVADPNRAASDVYVVGAHGATLMARQGVRPLQVFEESSSDQEVNSGPLQAVLRQYGQATIYYQTYLSLTRQDVARIELTAAVIALGKQLGTTSTSVISSRDYIFEPSLTEVVAHMEGMMLGVALSQVLLESKLAQYASRFNAMNAAHTKARSLHDELRLALSRAKRAQGDERTREAIGAIKAMQRVSREHRLQ